jgi:hypothetical protein
VVCGKTFCDPPTLLPGIFTILFTRYVKTDEQVQNCSMETERFTSFQYAWFSVCYQKVMSSSVAVQMIIYVSKTADINMKSIGIDIVLKTATQFLIIYQAMGRS